MKTLAAPSVLPQAGPLRSLPLPMASAPARTSRPRPPLVRSCRPVPRVQAASPFLSCLAALEPARARVDRSQSRTWSRPSLLLFQISSLVCFIDCFFSIEFRKRSESEDSIDYVPFVYFTDRLLHGFVLLPSGISVAGTGNAMF